MHTCRWYQLNFGWWGVRDDGGTNGHRGWASPTPRRQVVSEFTHYVVVHERTEGQKAYDLPEAVQVRQMLAAGWGGTGSVAMASGVICSQVMTDYDIPASIRRTSSPRASDPALAMQTAHKHPSSHLQRPDANVSLDVDHEDVRNFLKQLDERISRRFRVHVPGRLDTLERMGLDVELLKELRAIVEDGSTEAAVVLAFLATLF